MLTIGLTGGIGTGKSEVSRLLETLGASVVNADRIGHEAYKHPSPVWQEVVDVFGEGILGPDGEVDRKKLGSIVFADPKAMKKLNSIMHPRMAGIIDAKIGQLRSEGAQAVVLEAALLLEAGWDSMVDEVWLVHAPREIIVERLKVRSNLSEGEVEDRMRSQLAYEDASQRAQVVIHNTGELPDLRREVESSWAARTKGKVN
jgi:dephospho-CoA kinase